MRRAVMAGVVALTCGISLAETKTVQKKVGRFEYMSAEETYPVQREFLDKGTTRYFSPDNSLKSDVFQRVETFFDPVTDEWVMGTYFCTHPFSGAEQSYSCEGRVVSHNFETIEGNFQAVAMSLKHPLFATVRFGCCDGPETWTVYDLKGNLLCPEAEVDHHYGVQYPGSFPDANVSRNSFKCLGENGKTVNLKVKKETGMGESIYRKIIVMNDAGTRIGVVTFDASSKAILTTEGSDPLLKQLTEDWAKISSEKTLMWKHHDDSAEGRGHLVGTQHAPGDKNYIHAVHDTVGRIYGYKVQYE